MEYKTLKSLNEGSVIKIIDCHNTGYAKNKLTSLGLVPGTEIFIVAKKSYGMIVGIESARVAMTNHVASLLFVSEVS